MKALLPDLLQELKEAVIAGLAYIGVVLAILLIILSFTK